MKVGSNTAVIHTAVIHVAAVVCEQAQLQWQTKVKEVMINLATRPLFRSDLLHLLSSNQTSTLQHVAIFKKHKRLFYKMRFNLKTNPMTTVSSSQKLDLSNKSSSS